MPVRLSRRAAKDLDALPKKSASRVVATLSNLGDDPHSPALDAKALVGRRPWRRLRVGDFRILFRFSDDVVLVARVVDRKDLERAIRSLPDE